MRTKNKTVEMKRAREAKAWRNYYFGAYLPVAEPLVKISVVNEVYQRIPEN